MEAACRDRATKVVADPHLIAGSSTIAATPPNQNESMHRDLKRYCPTNEYRRIQSPLTRTPRATTLAPLLAALYACMRLSALRVKFSHEMIDCRDASGLAKASSSRNDNSLHIFHGMVPCQVQYGGSSTRSDTRWRGWVRQK